MTDLKTKVCINGYVAFRVCVVLLLGMLWVACASAAAQATSEPDKLVRENSQAQPNSEAQRKVDTILDPYDKPESPGCALGIVRDGDFLYRRGYGMGSLELQVPLSPTSVFYMGSVSKQFTAASVVLAAEQGYLSLDDDVRKWIPEIPSYGHTITLRHMLHHTSGLRDEIELLSLAGGRVQDYHPTAEFIDLIARQKALSFNPGDEYSYSNSNYVLLAEVVHRATGKPFSQFADENIFKPLGMIHTSFYDDQRVVLPGRVAAYSSRGNGGFRVDWSTNFDKVGDGGLMSSVNDLLFWDQNFYNNKLGKGTLLRELQTRGVLNSGKSINYALGLIMTQYRGLQVVEHGGALFGYRTEILRFPEQNFSVFCLCNLASANPAAKARQIADIYLDGQFPIPKAEETSNASTSASNPRPAALVQSDLDSFVGVYRGSSDHSFVTIAARDGGLVIGNPLADPTAVLDPIAVLKSTTPNLFLDPAGPEYLFERSASGAMQLSWGYRHGTKHILERIRPATLTTAEFSDYSGEYFSRELLATYKINGRGGKLFVTVGWNEPAELQPSLRDEFRGRLHDEFREPIVIQFVRDGKEITGFDLFAGFANGIRNIRFAKKQRPPAGADRALLGKFERAR